MNYRILVVDDESVTRRLVSHALKSLSIEVCGAGSGADALAEAQADPTLALALVDVNLPDMDGFAVIRHLRQIPHMQHIPMIIFTARSQSSDIAEATEVGAVNLLYKPFSMQSLREMVSGYLGISASG